ncbi:unnamed protein product [Camellia sinensis]
MFYFPQGHIEQDNGRGMPHDDIPNMFGRGLTLLARYPFPFDTIYCWHMDWNIFLSGTKYGLKQTRGKFGLGAKMALIWSKMSTGLPIDISSSMTGQNYSSFCRLDIDIHRTFLTFTYMKNGTIRNDGMELKSKLLLRGIEQLTVNIYSKKQCYGIAAIVKDQGSLLSYTFGLTRLTARRCQECGQTLPPTYQPPADEDWSTGIFGCTEDTDSCLTGLFCPCMLFGRNVENLNADISQRAACVGHIICVEGGTTFAALTSVLNGIDPQTLFLIYEGLFFAWWMCGSYTSMARQSLQKKYHLKVI